MGRVLSWWWASAAALGPREARWVRPQGAQVPSVPPPSSGGVDRVAFGAWGDAALAQALNLTALADQTGASAIRPVGLHAADGIRVSRLDGAGDARVVLASSTIEAPLGDVVAILRDPSRTRECNTHLAELREVERVGSHGQITHSKTPSLGPFIRRRDFVTAVHWRDLADGSVAFVSHAVRSQVVLGVQLLRSCPEDPSRTRITLLSSLRLGGAAVSGCGLAIANRMVDHAPVQFIRGLEAASQRRARPAGHVKARPRGWFDSIQPAARPLEPSKLTRVW